MSVIFASNNRVHWSASMTASTSSSYSDRAEVPYGLRLLDDTLSGLNFDFPAYSETEVWFQWDLAKSTLGSGLDDGYYCRVYDINNRECFRLNVTNGYVQAYLYGAATGITPSTLMAAGRFPYRIRYSNDGTNLSLDFFYNNVLVGTVATTNTNKGMPRRWKWDYNDATNGSDYMSSFVMSTTDLQNFAMNKVSCNALGTDNDFTGAVATVGDDLATSGMTATAVGNKQSYTKPVLTTTKSVHAFVPNALIYCGNTARIIRFYLLIGGVRYYGSNIQLVINKQNYVQEQWTLDPSDSQIWTAAKINAAEIGIEVVS